MSLKTILLLTAFAACTRADMRIAQGAAIQFRMPSNYGYAALIEQEKNNNDQFIRSNIDNQANQRNIQKEAPVDMLPCRQDQKGPVMTFVRGEQVTIPIRWNNPHDSSCEINIWKDNMRTVIPIKRPFPCGGGYQDQAYKFTFPKDFPGCESDAENCFLQIYAHSVETRTYTICIDFHLLNLVPAVSVPQTPLTSGTYDIPYSVPQPAVHYADSLDTAKLDKTFSGYRGQQREFVREEVLSAIAIRSFFGIGGLETPRIVTDPEWILGLKVQLAITKAEERAKAENQAKGICFEAIEYGNTDPSCTRQYDSTYVTNVGYKKILEEFHPQFLAIGLRPDIPSLKLPLYTS